MAYRSTISRRIPKKRPAGEVPKVRYPAVPRSAKSSVTTLKNPTGRKARRKLLKSAAWRLSGIIHDSPKELIGRADLRKYLEGKTKFGVVMNTKVKHLVNKIVRLRGKE